MQENVSINCVVHFIPSQNVLFELIKIKNKKKVCVLHSISKKRFIYEMQPKHIDDDKNKLI